MSFIEADHINEYKYGPIPQLHNTNITITNSKDWVYMLEN
jgi:hypothetical protein